MINYCQYTEGALEDIQFLCQAFKSNILAHVHHGIILDIYFDSNQGDPLSFSKYFLERFPYYHNIEKDLKISLLKGHKHQLEKDIIFKLLFSLKMVVIVQKSHYKRSLILFSLNPLKQFLTY